MSYVGYADPSMLQASWGVTPTAKVGRERTFGVLISASLRSPKLAPLLSELTAVAQEAGLLGTAEGAATLERAKVFLAALPSDMRLPELSVDPDGDIAFDWSEGGDLMSVSLGADGRLTYAWDVNNKPGSQTDRFGGVLPQTLVEALAHFE